LRRIELERREDLEKQAENWVKSRIKALNL